MQIRALWKNLLLMMISLALGLIVCEAVVRLVSPARMVGPSFTIYDSVYGKRLRTSFSAIRHTPEFSMAFSTNRDGYRGPVWDVTQGRPILFLGDSYTMGYGVNDGEEFPALIAEQIRQLQPQSPIPVINTGMGFNGNGRWIKLLKREASHYNPRLVVLQLVDNDFDDNVSEGLFALREPQGVSELAVPPPDAARMIQEFIDSIPGLPYSHLLGLANQARWAMVYDARHDSVAVAEAAGKHDQLTYALVQETLAICRQQGWPTVAILVGIDGERRHRLEGLFATSETPVLQIPSRQQRPDLYFRIDEHWNANGHRFTAAQLMQLLQQASVAHHWKASI